MISAVSQKDKNKLYTLFGRLDFPQNDAKLKKNYNTNYISVFDHWLTETEFKDTITHYLEDFGNDYEAAKQYAKCEQLFLIFYSYLYNHTEVYAQLFSSNARSDFITFDTEKAYLSYVLLSVRQHVFLEILLPEYRVVIDGNYDLTHILTVKKDYPQGLEAMSKIVKESGLYILS